MSAHSSQDDSTLPLWRRLRHWVGHSTPTRRDPSNVDSASLDLGYEAAYPGHSAPESAWAHSTHFEDDRAG